MKCALCHKEKELTNFDRHFIAPHKYYASCRKCLVERSRKNKAKYVAGLKVDIPVYMRKDSEMFLRLLDRTVANA